MSRNELPVTATTFILARVPVTRVTCLPRRKVSRGAIIWSSAVDIGVGRRRVVPSVGIVVAASWRWVIVHGAARRRAVTSTFVVVLAAGAALTVPLTITISAWAVASRGTTSVVVVNWRRVGSTAAAGRTRPSAAHIAARRHVRLCLVKREHKHSLIIAYLFSLTSATQVTRLPLNSRPSSFSTAVLKSAAVSNSTKLDGVLVSKRIIASVGLRSTYPRPLPSRGVSE